MPNERTVRRTADSSSDAVKTGVLRLGIFFVGRSVGRIGKEEWFGLHRVIKYARLVLHGFIQLHGVDLSGRSQPLEFFSNSLYFVLLLNSQPFCKVSGR